MRRPFSGSLFALHTDDRIQCHAALLREEGREGGSKGGRALDLDFTRPAIIHAVAAAADDGQMD